MSENKGGRPSVMTPEVRAEILGRIADGESVRQICRDEHMPNRSTVYQLVANDKQFADQYARAMEARLERWADEIVEIADDGTNDWLEREDKQVVNAEHINRSRLRVDTRKWIMSKLAPKKYGDKVQHTGASGDGPVEMVHEVVRRVVHAKPGD